MNLSNLTRAALLCACISAFGHAHASPPACHTGTVYSDENGNHQRDAGEHGLAGISVSDGLSIVQTDAQGRYVLPPQPGRTVFVVKPPGWTFPLHNGLPMFWRHQPDPTQPALKFGGIQNGEKPRDCDFALRREQLPASRQDGLRVLVFGDPQPKSLTDVGYYARGIIESVLETEAVSGQASSSLGLPATVADLGLSLGDIVDDDLSLYPAVNAQTARLRVPWLHAPGNHDIDFDASTDAQSLLTFRNTFGSDTLAWEEPEASFIVLDNVIYQPDERPSYIGGFREDQFEFLENYLRNARRDRLLVLSMHIPLFEDAGRDTFRNADRERLFALLQPFDNVLLLTAHKHTQQHYYHDASTGWHGAQPLHEYNVGATCGAFWSGTKDARGVPDSMMADGTPKGWARLQVHSDGRYALSYHPANDPRAAMHLHAPQVLRAGAYPGHAVYANIHMATPTTQVQYRVGQSRWQPMQRVQRPDPVLVMKNVQDDLAETLTSYDRSIEAENSTHLWRGRLPTDLGEGQHTIEVRALDAWRGEVGASTHFRLQAAPTP